MKKPSAEEIHRDYVRLAVWAGKRFFKSPKNGAGWTRDMAFEARAALYVAWDRFDWETCEDLDHWRNYLIVTVKGELKEWVARNGYPLSGSPYGLKNAQEFGRPVWERRYYDDNSSLVIESPLEQAENYHAKRADHGIEFSGATHSEMLMVALKEVTPDLSDDELAVLEGFQQGLSDYEIADDLGCSSSKVRRLRVGVLCRLREAALAYGEAEQGPDGFI